MSVLLAFWPSLAGGMMIGLAAAMLLIVNGRIAGISGIAGGLLGPVNEETSWRLAFLAGLILGPVTYLAAAGHQPLVRIGASCRFWAWRDCWLASARGLGRAAQAVMALAASRGCLAAPSVRSPPSWERRS